MLNLYVTFDLLSPPNTHVKHHCTAGVCRNRAYADRAYSAPPSIDNAAQHPFLAQFEGEGGPAQAGEGDSEAGSAQPSRAATPVPQAARAPPAVKASPAKAAAPPEAPPVALFDLLSMDDVRRFLTLRGHNTRTSTRLLRAASAVPHVRRQKVRCVLGAAGARQRLAWPGRRLSGCRAAGP